MVVVPAVTVTVLGAGAGAAELELDALLEALLEALTEELDELEVCRRSIGMCMVAFALEDGRVALAEGAAGAIP